MINKLLDTNGHQTSDFNGAMRPINEPDDIRGNEIIDDNQHLKKNHKQFKQQCSRKLSTIYQYDSSGQTDRSDILRT